MLLKQHFFKQSRTLKYECVRSLAIRFFILVLGLILAVEFVAAQGQGNEKTNKESYAEIRKKGASKSSFTDEKPKVEPAAKPTANLDDFKTTVQPILKAACVDCHGPETQEGDFRVDNLDPNLLKGKDVDWWLEVRDVLSKGEMPPPDEKKLTEKDRGKVIDWLSSEILAASQFRRRNAEHSSFRRMTRYEFNYAFQDLLGRNWNFARDLPPEPNSEDGFQNSSEMLHMSVKQLEIYRRLARHALQRTTISGEKPPALRWKVSMADAGKVDWQKQDLELQKLKNKFKDQPEKLASEIKQFIESHSKAHSTTYFKNLTDGRTVAATWSYGKAKYAILPTESDSTLRDSLDHAAIIPQGRRQKLTIELGDQVPDDGIMRIRVRACKLSPDENKIPSLQIDFGFQASNEGRADIRVSTKDTPVRATPEAPQVYQWDIPLGDIYPRNDVRGRSKLGQMPNPSEFIRLVNGSISQGSIRIDSVEITTPFFEQWPPKSHLRIFPEKKSSVSEEDYARRILKSFMHRAWRRPIIEAEVERKLKLFAAIRPDCESFEECMVEVLSTVLASPNFLYVINRPSNESNAASSNNSNHNQLNSSELATRLSMFLWCSVPDQELLNLAEQNQLVDPNILASQVERMLRDPRASRFSKHFVEQWLDMQLLEFLNFKRTYRGVDPQLKESMQQEPIAFFQEVLNRNQSVLDFIHSDFTMADERLTIHYGLPRISGNDFQRVSLNPDKKRGGILTQAGLLTMNSDGKDSHPLKRGVWLLESILNDPPPPPPPAVPEIDLADPEIAKMTLKQRIENHRNHAACRSCHAKIDPWGIAFENYDAIGRFRTKIKGKVVDANSKLFNDQPLNGMQGLKKYLLANRQDQFVSALVHKLSTFALGRPMTFADRSELDRIVAKVRKQGDGLATMVKEIVVSNLFLSR